MVISILLKYQSSEATGSLIKSETSLMTILNYSLPYKLVLFSLPKHEKSYLISIYKAEDLI